MRELLGARRLLFVGGKGGVGKTSTAAALALAAAAAGRRCLVVSTDPAHSLGDVFERDIGRRETMLAPNLTGLEIDPDEQAERYIAGVKQSMRSLVRPALYDEIDRQMDLARLAPGATEAAMMERVAEVMSEELERYDLVVFDTAPTGHTLRLLSLPEVMAAWTEGMLRRQERSSSLGRILQRLGGRPGQGDDLSYIDQAEEAAAPDDRTGRIRAILLERRRKFHRARRLMLDPETTAFILVMIPEKLPILESKRALAALRRFDVPVAAVVVNRVLPAEADGEFLRTRRRQEEEYLQEIAREFADLPRHHLPLFARDVRGLEMLTALGRALVA